MFYFLFFFAKPTWGWAWTQAPTRGDLGPGILGEGGGGKGRGKGQGKDRGIRD